MIRSIFVCFLFVLSISIAGADEPVITVLDNGLTVITQEFHYAPVIASVISYRVGSRNETGDILGMSHFCEHLMFKGTPDMPKSRFWQIVQRDGGSANAFTMEDATCYYLILPSSRIEDAFAIESDRMVNCNIDSAEVVSERNVVHEERRSRTTDSPDGALWEALGETAFTEHPYSNPIIGYDENILAYDHFKAREFYESWYCPSNAVLSVVGDFDTEELLAQIESYFGDIPAGSTPPEPDIVEPEQSEARYIEIEHASNLPRFIMAFHIPCALDPATPALEIISSYLVGGRSGRLDQILVETNLVQNVWAGNDLNIDPGLFYFSVTMFPPGDSDISIQEVQDMIWAELDIITSDGISIENLADQKNRYRAWEILSNANPAGQAMQYSLGMTMFNDPLLSKKQLEEVELLTPEDISDVAQRYFRRNGVTIAVLNPSGGMGMEGQSSHDELPTDVTEPSSIDYEGLEIPEDFLIPPGISIADGVIQFDLQNDLILLVKEDHTFPVAAVSFTVPMGTLMSPSDLNGLVSITTETMLKGTDELNSTEFHKRLEMEGSYLRFYPGEEYSTGSVTLLSEDIEMAFESISDLLIRPAFRTSDYETVLNEAYADLEMSAERSFSVAWDSLQAITAMSSSDYRNPSEETLDRITLDTVESFHEICCRPGGSVIAVVGDVDAQNMYELTQNYFGDWSNPSEPLPLINIPLFSDSPGDTVLTPMPGRVQVAVMIGRNAPGLHMPDFPAFNVMNVILGRGIGSRLGHSVRDEQGLAYSVGSWTSSYDSTGTFIAYLSTLADYAHQATSSVIAEMERIGSENVRDIELLLAKANAAGKLALSGMSYSQQASRLAMLTADGRPLNWDLIYLEDVLELTPDDLREAAARYLIPDEWFVSIAGGIQDNNDTEE
jgi:zinc protease